METTENSDVEITIIDKRELDSSIVATTGLAGEQFGVLVTIGAGVAENDKRGHGLRKAVHL